MTIATRKPVRGLAAQSQRGMTLIEILVVLAIIGLIMGGVAVVASNALGGAKEDTARKDISNLEQSVEMYMIKSGKCPKTVQDIKAAGIIKKATKDPWGNAYEIKCPGEHGEFDISSPGKDGQMGTDDDINSWSDKDSEDPDNS